MIVCKRTGKTWPDEKRTDIKTCVECGGLIDIRHEAWKGDPNGGSPHHNVCPPQKEDPRSTTPSVNQVQKPKITGRELLERNEWYKRNILDKENESEG